MKIAMVITSLEVGGAEKMVLDLISQMHNETKIKLFIIRRNYHTIYDQLAEDLKIDIEYVNNNTKVFSIISAIILKKMIDKFRPDIIHTHLKASDYIYYYYLFKRNFKWIHTVHTQGKVDVKYLRRLMFRKLYQRKIINLVAVSNSVSNSLCNLYKNLELRVINNGIDLKKFNNQKREITPKSICHVGRFVEVKNHEYLIREFKKVQQVHNDVELVLIGDGELKFQMVKLVNKLGLIKHVKFIGYTNHVENYLLDSNIFVLPSYYEGMPLALVEAMAVGLIVIASYSAGKDIVDDGTDGYLINIEPNILSNLIINIINNYSGLKDIQEQAILKSKQYSLKAMGEKYKELYLEVMK